MIDDKRHVPVLDAFISWAARLLNANETLIREMVHERAGWFVRFAGLDEKIDAKILEGLTKLFDEMETDPAHPVPLRAEEMLARLSAALHNVSDSRARLTRLKPALMTHPAVGPCIEGSWATGAR